MWSQDGSLVALGARPSAVRILDRSGREVMVLPGEGVDQRIVDALFSPDGRYLATSVRVRGGTGTEQNGSVRIWDWGRRDVVQEIEAGFGPFAFDRTGTRLVTFDGKVVGIWDIRTGARVAEEFVASAAPIWDVAISPDGSRIATSFRDASISLLDTITGEQVVLRGGTGPGSSTLSFSPDGERLASVGFGLFGGSVRIWALDVDDLLGIARGEVMRGFTDEECQHYLHVDVCPAT